MDFLLWTARSLHLFSIAVWFGGLFYQAVVTFPVAKSEHKELDERTRHFVRRFIPFIWMCIFTILVTGIALMLFDPRFVFLRFNTMWSTLLGLKEIIFFAMVFFTFGYLRMFRMVDRILNGEVVKEDVSGFARQMLLYGKINVALAIASILIAAGMNS